MVFNATTGRFTGTPPAHFNGAIDVTVTASDGSLSVSDNFSLNITAVNDGPVAQNDSGLTTTVGTALTISTASLIANDRDVDGDALSISSVGNAVGGTVSLNAQGQVVFTATSAGTGSFSYTLSDGTATSVASVSVQATAAVQATTIMGTSKHNLIIGTMRDDVIDALAGHDIVLGLAGNDIIYGGSGNDLLNGGDDNDSIIGGLGNDLVIGGTGSDIVFGEEGNDQLLGLSGNDLLSGGSGNDDLAGSDGNDILIGGSGNDWIYGGDGFDTLVLAGTRASYSMSSVGGQLRIRDNLVNVDGNDGQDTLIGVERIQFSDGAYMLIHTSGQVPAAFDGRAADYDYYTGQSFNPAQYDFVM